MAYQNKVVIQALAEKYNVPQAQVEEILSLLPQRDLPRMSWRDIDTVVQEGLVQGAGGEYPSEESETTLDTEFFYRAGFNSAAGYRD